MTQENLLSGGDQFQFDEDKNYLEELVGEGKKFKDEAALAKGKAYSDAMIAQVTKENASLRQEYLDLRNEYNARAKLEDIAKQLSQQTVSSSEQNHNANEDRNNAQNQFDPNQIESVFNNLYQKQETLRQERENFNQVRDKLIERFGNNYQAVVKTHVDALGMTDEEFNSYARRNPKLLYRALGLDQEKKQDLFQTPPSSNTLKNNFSPSAKKRNWAYYEDMRVKQPDLYKKRETLLMMDADSQEQGTAFFQ